ncbi:peptidase M16 [Polaribacter reichenbachii]|uniref:Peptidase M16 n=1 Tax=Polaribacter reichenbachii TaxID=996801 RepID=A0A1B8TQ92_9FLAO|nr:insulinase family protein [Polaribacter reichenbachii]APZ46758.1 peptidase M16 [Polaribacter reichenbachii]AUC17401.1 peptidase M16 [Polaribacter reichenbachii]OBY61724.1 peptidase M16 [Polaribacter reichenbachii]
MKRVLFILFLSVFTTSFYAQKMMDKKIPIDESVKIGKLSNGLTYYIKNNGKPANKVELRLAINAGSILEDEDQLGVAHFMEHMNFNGTKNFKKNELVDYLQSIGVKFGADLNAYTGFDQTVYILPIPSDDEAKLDKGFQIIRDWAGSALLEDKDIDDERGVVLEEYRSRRGADSRMMEKYLPKLMYGSKYADRLPIGTEESIKNFSYESIRRFQKDWYRPDLMAVIAVGDVDVAELENKIKKYFNDIPASKNPRKRESFSIKNHEETFISIESDKESPFSRVQLMYKDYEDTKPTETVVAFRKSIVESLFSQMLNNRLDELRNGENPPFIFGFSYHGGTYARNREAYQSVANTSADGQLKGLEALLEESERAKRFGFTTGELERAKKNVLSRLEKSYNDRDKNESGRIAGAYVNHFLDKSPIPGIAWTFNMNKKLLPTIQLEEINEVIKNFIHDDNRVIIITGPKQVVTEQQVLDALNNVKTKELKPYEDKEVAASLITDAPTMGKIVGATKNDELGTKTFVLENGAKVTYKKTDFKNDEILFTAYSYGGTSLYSDEELKATSFANAALTDAGVNGYSKSDLRKMMSGKIANVRPYISGLSEGFNGSASPKNLEELFQLVHLYFTSLNKDDKAFKSSINKNKSFLGNLLASPNFFFQKEMSDFMNEGNSRYTGFPSEEKYDAADYDLAYAKYNERFADAGDFNFYFVGNIDERKLAELTMKYIASLPGKDSKETYKVDEFRPLKGSHTKIVEKGKDPKSSVRITYQGETTYNKKEALAFKSLGEIVGIKLTEKLREEEGGVYSSRTSGNISKMPYGRYNFSISFPCAPENVDKLKNIALAQVEDMAKNGPTEEDLMKTKKAQILDYKESIKRNRYWLNFIKNIDYMKNDASDATSFEERVNALTKEDIQMVAKKYLTDGYILGILNPEK